MSQFNPNRVNLNSNIVAVSSRNGGKDSYKIFRSPKLAHCCYYNFTLDGSKLYFKKVYLKKFNKHNNDNIRICNSYRRGDTPRISINVKNFGFVVHNGHYEVHETKDGFYIDLRDVSKLIEPEMRMLKNKHGSKEDIVNNINAKIPGLGGFINSENMSRKEIFDKLRNI